MLFTAPVFVGYSYFVFVMQPVSSKHYSPCELASVLYKALQDRRNVQVLGAEENVGEYLKSVPLLVCIAGYHGYNTNFSYTTQDTVRHVGIFGLAEGEAPADRKVETHSMKFLRDILHIRGSPWKNGNTYDFYESLCNVPHLASNVLCHLDSYVFGNYPVIVPRDLDYLYNYYQSKDAYWTPLENHLRYSPNNLSTL